MAKKIQTIKPERNKAICILHNSGMTYAEIGDSFNITGNCARLIYERSLKQEEAKKSCFYPLSTKFINLLNNNEIYSIEELRIFLSDHKRCRATEKIGLCTYAKLRDFLDSKSINEVKG